jgi:hypothetical protein
MVRSPAADSQREERHLNMKKDFVPALIFIATPTLVAFMAEADTCGHTHALRACPTPVIPLTDAPHRDPAPVRWNGLSITVSTSASGTSAGPLIWKVT